MLHFFIIIWRAGPLSIIAIIHTQPCGNDSNRNTPRKLCADAQAQKETHAHDAKTDNHNHLFHFLHLIHIIS